MSNDLQNYSMCCPVGAQCLAKSGQCSKSPCNAAVCAGLIGVFLVCTAAYNFCAAKQAFVAAHSPAALHLFNVAGRIRTVGASPSRRARAAYRNRMRAESIDRLQDELLEGSMAYPVATIPADAEYGTMGNGGGGGAAAEDDDDVPVAKYASLDTATAVDVQQRGPVLVEPPTAVVPSGGRAV